MGARGQRDTLQPAGRASFTTTHWSVVITAGTADDTKAHEALTTLCEWYWYPLYAFARRRGCTSADAQDLTQGFFLRLLEKNYVRDADRAKGRFRTFLLTSFKHFMANEWNRAHALKRGGNAIVVSIDEQDAESRYKLEPGHGITPDKLYERRWALSLLDRVLGRLRDECEKQGKTALFEQLRVLLTEGRSAGSYAEIASGLGMSDGAFKVAVHRLRQRYGEILREEIRHTVRSPEEVKDELRHLLTVFNGQS